MAVVIEIVLDKLAKIASKVPEYSVLDEHGNEITKIAYARTVSGRRKLSYIEFYCGERYHYCDAQTVVRILD